MYKDLVLVLEISTCTCTRLVEEENIENGGFNAGSFLFREGEKLFGEVIEEDRSRGRVHHAQPAHARSLWRRAQSDGRRAV